MAGFEWLTLEEETNLDENLDDLATRMKKAINESLDDKNVSKTKRKKDGANQRKFNEKMNFLT